MKPTQCANGHFFDGDKYATCPHCGAGPATTVEITSRTQDKKSGSSKKTNNDVEIKSVTEKTRGKTFGVFRKRHTVEQPHQETEESAIQHDLRASDTPDSLYKESINTSLDSQPEVRSEEHAKTEEDVEDVVEVISVGGAKADEATTPHNESKEETTPSDEGSKKRSLQDEIKSVAANSGGKTTGIFFSGSQSNVEHEPVVGWLVCVRGKHFGESFNISEGRNSIGRNETNKIVLAKDDSVSRVKHLWITYEPKKREFFVQPGEGSGLSYLNDDNIMESKKVAPYDKLELGKGLYILVPLCGDNFTWEDYINE